MQYRRAGERGQPGNASGARGRRKVLADAGRVSFESVEAVMRLLTPENRQLLAIIEEKKPASVADLARLLRRAEPNGSRTLANWSPQVSFG